MDVFERADLLDRAIIIRLDDLPDTCRRTESDFWAAFTEAQPRILGALLYAVVVALRDERSVRLPRLPRMADFARWVCAGEAALPWKRGDFLRAYEANRATAAVALLDDDSIGCALRDVLSRWPDAWWEGSATDLFKLLQGRGAIPPFEKDPRKATSALKRLTAGLRAVGIEVSSTEKHGGRKLICLCDTTRVSE